MRERIAIETRKYASYAVEWRACNWLTRNRVLSCVTHEGKRSDVVMRWWDACEVLNAFHQARYERLTIGRWCHLEGSFDSLKPNSFPPHSASTTPRETRTIAADVPHGLVVAIDGPSGSGKSSTSRGVAARLGLRYLDTVDVPRDDVVDAAADVDVHDPARVAAAVRRAPDRDRHRPAEATITVDGDDVAEAIRAGT